MSDPSTPFDILIAVREDCRKATEKLTSTYPDVAAACRDALPFVERALGMIDTRTIRTANQEISIKPRDLTKYPDIADRDISGMERDDYRFLYEGVVNESLKARFLWYLRYDLALVIDGTQDLPRQQAEKAILCICGVIGSNIKAAY